jgi:DNA-binding transcriptional ArsR family regulator
MTIPDVDSTFRALSDPTRRQILRLVARRPLSAGDIATHFDASRPAISQHLRILRTAGLVTESREGARRIYRAESAPVEAAIEHLRSFWPTRLVELKRQAERQERHRRGRV